MLKIRPKYSDAETWIGVVSTLRMGAAEDILPNGHEFFDELLEFYKDIQRIDSARDKLTAMKPQFKEKYELYHKQAEQQIEDLLEKLLKPLGATRWSSAT